MKYGRGKWGFGAVLLAARDAARRFTFGHGSAARGRGSWRPLILQWRRRRRRQENLLSDRAATPTPIFWFPQFHFHYATRLSSRSRRDRSLSSSPAAGGPRTRIVQDHRWTTVRTAEPRAQQHHDFRPLGPSYAPPSSRPKIDGGLPNAPGRAHSLDTPPIVPLVARRPLALQFGNAPKLANAKGKAEERAQPFQSHSRIWQHWLQILRVRQPTLDYRLPHRSPQHNSPRMTLNEPEELVWRRTNRPATEDPNVERHQVTADSFDRPAVRTFKKQAVVDHSPMSERAATLQLTKVDPSFLDRLTDDVIRRVEKRARIERQRRGL